MKREIKEIMATQDFLDFMGQLEQLVLKVKLVLRGLKDIQESKDLEENLVVQDYQVPLVETD